jgi:hypothetical protein
MVQTLYALTAIFLVAILSMTMNRTIHGSETRMVLHEVSAQVTPIAADLFDLIGSLPYDAATQSGVMVRQLSRLSPVIAPSTFCDAVLSPGSCLVMNDLHGQKVTRDVKGLTYEIAIALEYVDPQPPANTSYKKKATVTITNPHITRANGTPLEMVFTRMFVYPRVTG